MKVAIVGSRSITVKNIQDYIPEDIVVDEIVSGGARGVDACAKKYALENRIPYKEFLPDYRRYSHGAPIIRNRQIVDYADIVIILWDGESKGTKNVWEYCNKIDKKIIGYQL